MGDAAGGNPDSDAKMKWKRAKTKIKAVNNVKEGEIQLNHWASPLCLVS
jgi:hypothetical protein